MTRSYKCAVAACGGGCKARWFGPIQRSDPMAWAFAERLPGQEKRARCVTWPAHRDERGPSTPIYAAILRATELVVCAHWHCAPPLWLHGATIADAHGDSALPVRAGHAGGSRAIHALAYHQRRPAQPAASGARTQPEHAWPPHADGCAGAGPFERLRMYR